MNIHIDPTDGLPIYRQIANQVRYMVASGLLLADEELRRSVYWRSSCGSRPTPW